MLSGPRICLGQQFAYNESSFFLIRLLQSFSSFTLAKDAQPLEGRPRADWKAMGGRAAVEEIFLRSHLTMFVRVSIRIRFSCFCGWWLNVVVIVLGWTLG